MGEAIEERNDMSALWMGWIGVIAGILSFFTLPIILGVAAIVLGIITVNSRAKALGWSSIVVGAIGFIVHWSITGTFF